MRESFKRSSEPLPQDGWQRLENTLPSLQNCAKNIDIWLDERCSSDSPIYYCCHVSIYN